MFFNNPYYDGPKSDHFDGKRFFYPCREKPPTVLDLLKWKFSSKKVKWSSDVFQHVVIKNTFKKHSLSLEVTYIGHSSFLVQLDGLNILLDPVFSQYAGPVKASNLKRRIPPGISLNNLPKIDLILLSHNHYDHCDIAFLKKIIKKDHPTLVVPLGLDKQLLSNQFRTTIIALDWHQSIFHKSVQLTLTPAKHWSSRTMFDKNMTLWGSFVIKGNSESLFFMGDSGYDSHLFKNIGHCYGPFDLSLISIGAYHPRWFMKFAHMDPREACLAHLDLKSHKSIAMHHRTFPLADEGPLDPEKDLAFARQSLGISEQDFAVLQEGSSCNARKF